VQELLGRCQLPTWRFATATAEIAGLDAEASVVVLGAVENMEVLASCEVLQMMLQETLQRPVRVARSAKAASGGVCSSLVVVLTKGLFEDATFAEALLGCYRGDAQGLVHMVPVLADSLFQFPTAETYSKLEDVGLPPLGKEVGARLVEAYSDLFATIALPFSPLASEAVLKLQVSELCRRRLSNRSAGSLAKIGSLRPPVSAQPSRMKDVEELSDDVPWFSI